MISFETEPIEINGWTIVHLPKTASANLPSRGQVMVKGSINGSALQTALEPDGNGSHWFKVDAKMQKSAKATVGDKVKIAIEATKDWPEPDVPADLTKAIKADPKMQAQWKDITPMARWEWIRWINSTNQPKTRKHRIEVSRSKMVRGERRPCCFNRSMCCVPEVSKSGVLLAV